MHELGVDLDAFSARAVELEGAGRTVSWLADVTVQPQLLGLLAFGDTLKAEAGPAIARLHALGIRTAMLTGDNRGSATTVARQLDIDIVHSQVLPEYKAAIVAPKIGRAHV